MAQTLHLYAIAIKSLCGLLAATGKLFSIYVPEDQVARPSLSDAQHRIHRLEYRETNHRALLLQTVHHALD